MKQPQQKLALSRIAAIERIKMLRNRSKVRFGEAAARRREVGSMSGVGRNPPIQ